MAATSAVPMSTMRVWRQDLWPSAVILLVHPGQLQLVLPSVYWSVSYVQKFDDDGMVHTFAIIFCVWFG